MITKVSVLAAACAACLVSGAAVAKAPAPQPITDADQCTSCDMWITKWPGPKAQIVMKNGKVHKYCSVKCMSCTLIRLGDSDNIAKIFVHDAGRVNWEKPGDTHYIDARTAWYVQGSSRKATMGKSVAPFSSKAAAERFQKEYGGTIYRFKEMTKDILGCKVPKKPAQPL